MIGSGTTSLSIFPLSTCVTTTEGGDTKKEDFTTSVSQYMYLRLLSFYFYWATRNGKTILSKSQGRVWTIYLVGSWTYSSLCNYDLQFQYKYFQKYKWVWTFLNEFYLCCTTATLYLIKKIEQKPTFCFVSLNVFKT